MKKTETISNQILALEGYLQNFELTNSLVSEVSVGWHIEHSLLTIEKIVYALSNSNPNNYRWSLRLSRYIIFALNRIPRGKAKAPEIVKPSEFISLDNLHAHLNKTKSLIQLLETLPKMSFSNTLFSGI